MSNFLGYTRLMLGFPLARRYRAPLPPDDPIAVEARRRAARDRDAGMTRDDWPPDERDAWQEDRRAYLTLAHHYEAARHPDQIRAPAAWPAAALVIVAGTLVAANDARAESWRTMLLLLFVHQVAWTWIGRLDVWAGRRSARRHGLTPKDAPLLRAPAFGPAGILACRRWRRADHAPRVPRVSWSTWLAYRLIAEFNERRSWRRALRG